MRSLGRILIVEDDPPMRQMCVKLFQRKGYDAIGVGSGEEALFKLEEEEPQVVLADMKMPGMDGIELLKVIKARYKCEVIFMTGYGTIQNAVQAMKLGAFDYITKPFDNNNLVKIVEKAIKLVNHKTQNPEEGSFDNLIIGKSPGMQSVLEKMRAASKNSCNVLICGESGTGKELVARFIHHNTFPNGPFIAVNCAALPRELIESELFGYRKGAFTGAISDNIGLFKAAEGGTIFLDEIAEMNHHTQAKLLRTLQNKTIRPIGAMQEIPVEVRVIAATNRNVSEALREGLLRQDLYYRLSVISLIIPPLRERKEDIPLLVDHFIGKFNKKFGRNVEGIEEGALELLKNYHWPGNVRELENTIEGAFVLGTSNLITVEDLYHKIYEERQNLLGEEQPLLTFKEAEKKLLQKALALAENNKSRAAKMLGISRKSLYKKMKTYGLEG